MVAADRERLLAPLATHPAKRTADEDAGELIEFPRESGRRDDDLGEVHADRAGVLAPRPIRIAFVATALVADDGRRAS